jgi:hypothetical protein
VTVRGHDAVVVTATDAPDRLLPLSSDAFRFLAFMEGLDMDGLHLTREPDCGRDVETPDGVL